MTMIFPPGSQTICGLCEVRALQQDVGHRCHFYNQADAAGITFQLLTPTGPQLLPLQTHQPEIASFMYKLECAMCE